ncbi:MAG: ABC transporter ATP-binding protein [Candidatus Faecousia sp.]|nr:ABC transporter ATP-binding protein [Bacillota bacterium]MDY2810395.1 ABC transporter ATP-binding protein [Candidatus Faecousia sp.]
MLSIEHFTKTYGEKKAVSDLTLHIAPGDICGFIGHNGAGKTTTLKACCGILPFDEGEITVCGHSIRTDPIACKQVLSYVPDNPDLYEFLTGFQYLNFAADIYGVSKTDRTDRIQEFGEKLGMTDDLTLPISDCSHGMKQKIALMAALIHQPRLILLDEPFVGLDPIATHQLKTLMHEHCQRGGAIFFSTHVLEVAQNLCNKVAIIKNGALVASGTMEEVRGSQSLEQIFLELEGQA